MSFIQADEFTIDLTIDEKVFVALLMKRDGTVMRQGNGKTFDGPLFEGKLDPAIFEQALALFPEQAGEYLGQVYDFPTKKGNQCELEITFRSGENVQGMKFLYGTESMSPPKFISDFSQQATALTDDWFEDLVKRKRKENKKWWQLWK